MGQGFFSTQGFHPGDWSVIMCVLSTFQVYVLRAESMYSSYILKIFRAWWLSPHQAEPTLICHEPKKNKRPPFLTWLTSMRQRYLTEKRKLQTHATYISYEMEIWRHKCLHSTNSFGLSHLRRIVNRNCRLTSTRTRLLTRIKMENRAGKDIRWVGKKAQEEAYEV